MYYHLSFLFDPSSQNPNTIGWVVLWS